MLHGQNGIETLSQDDCENGLFEWNAQALIANESQLQEAMCGGVDRVWCKGRVRGFASCDDLSGLVFGFIQLRVRWLS